MTIDVMKDFMEKKEKLDDEQYLKTTLDYHLAPVTLCKKTSSILTFNKRNRNLYMLWDTYKDNFLSSSELEFYELKRTDKCITVLFFFSKCMLNELEKSDNKKFLCKYGYAKCNTLDSYLMQLKKRYKKECPHEIGLFLGVPLKDVEAFIEHDGNKFLVCGYWKVYHKVKQSVSKFTAYDNARHNIVRLFNLEYA